MAWTTPVIDRTQSDVDYAIANQNSASDLKGAWNVSDANRVIDNTLYLKELLNAQGYYFPYTAQSHITETDFPYKTSFVKVMKDNINNMVSAFYSSGNPVITYNTNPNYITANNMEINLKTTNELLILMIQSFRICGTFACGTSFRL